MDAKQKPTFADTYVLDEDVMDEMENFESTQVLSDSDDELAETRTQQNKFLEDVDEGTVVLDEDSAQKKS